MKMYLLHIALFLFPVGIFCQQVVTLEEVKTVGLNYLSSQVTHKSSYSMVEIEAVYHVSKKAATPAIYEILLQDGNSILLSGSKACIPVLGYNLSGNAKSVLHDDNISPGLQIMLDGMISDIDSCLLNDTISLYHQSSWAQVLSADFLQTKNAVAQVGPLTTSQWGQSASNDTKLKWKDYQAYNYYVTESSDDCGGICLAGCVSVAMAQLLHYWKHPMNRGFFTYYDWCNMPDALIVEDNPNYETERNAIAKLIYDCAESVNMDYCSSGCASSASIRDIVEPLKYSYGFSNEIDFQRKNWYNNNTWIGRIKNNINNGWPVLYRGQKAGGGGHAFICDGYRDDDYFCFNWGWYGSNNELWITLSDMNPGISDGYSKRQRAIFYIQPDDRFINHCESIVNLPIVYSQYNASGGSDFWNIVPDNGRILQSCSSDMPESWRTIPTGKTSQYAAFESVVLRPGFTAKSGCDFRAFIKECPNCERQGTVATSSGKNYAGSNAQALSYMDDAEAYMGESTHDDCGDPPPNIVKSSALDEAKSEGDIRVYPNPNSGAFSIKTLPDYLPYDLLIRNNLGQVVYEQKSIKSELMHIDISAHRGFYIIEIRSAQGRFFNTIIVQ